MAGDLVKVSYEALIPSLRETFSATSVVLTILSYLEVKHDKETLESISESCLANGYLTKSAQLTLCVLQSQMLDFELEDCYLYLWHVQLQGMDYFAVRKSYYDAFSQYGENMEGTLHILHKLTSTFEVNTNRALSLMQLIKYEDHMSLEQSLEKTQDLTPEDRLNMLRQKFPAYNLGDLANLLRESPTTAASASAFLPFLEENSQMSIDKMKKMVQETMDKFDLNSIGDAILLLKSGKLPDSNEEVTAFVKEMARKYAMPSAMSFFRDYGGLVEQGLNFAAKVQFSMAGAQGLAKSALQQGFKGGFPQMNFSSVKTFVREAALQQMWNQFDADGNGEVDGDEMRGLVKMLLDKFLHYSSVDLDPESLEGLIERLVEGLLASSKSGTFLTYEEFCNTATLMTNFKKLLTEIDLPGIATRAILNKIWDSNESSRTEDGFPVAVCKQNVTEVLTATMTNSMLAQMGFTKSEFEAVCDDMVQSIMDIVDINKDGTIDQEEFLLIGALVSKFLLSTRMATHGKIDLSIVGEIANQEFVLTQYWNRYDVNKDNQMDEGELKELLEDLVGNFVMAISVWSGNEVPEEQVSNFINDFTKRVFEELDDDKSGFISHDEFVNIGKVFQTMKDMKFDINSFATYVSSSMVEELWKRYDSDGSGALEAEEIQGLIAELLKGFNSQTGGIFRYLDVDTNKVVNEHAERLTTSLMQRLDADGSGELSKDEFGGFAEWLEEFMEMDDLSETMKLAFLDELWTLYDDDESGFFEKAEVFAVIHNLICRIPETQDFWGEIQKEDTEKPCRTMWNKCKEFNVGKRKQISKDEFTNFMYYINELDDMNELVDLKELRERVERRQHDKAWAEFSKKNKINSEGIRDLILQLQSEIDEMEASDDLLSETQIGEISLRCIDDLGAGKPFLNKKKFYRFKSWFDAQEPIVEMHNSIRSMRTTERSSAIMFDTLGAAWSDRKRRQTQALEKSKTLTDLLKDDEANDPNSATLKLMESTAHEMAHDQIDFYGDKLINTMVHFGIVEIEKNKDPCGGEFDCYALIEGFFFFIGSKIGLVVALPFAILAFVSVVIGFILSFAVVLATGGFISDVNGVCVACFVLITLTWVVIFHTIIMIIDLESGALGLVFAILQSVLVSTYIQASLHYLDEETNWFELPAFLRWLFTTIVNAVKSDLKSRDLSELAKIMMEANTPSAPSEKSMIDVQIDGPDLGFGGNQKAAVRMLKMKSIQISEHSPKSGDHRASLTERLQIAKETIELAPMNAKEVAVQISRQPNDVDIKPTPTKHTRHKRSPSTSARKFKRNPALSRSRTNHLETESDQDLISGGKRKPSTLETNELPPIKE